MQLPLFPLHRILMKINSGGNFGCSRESLLGVHANRTVKGWGQHMTAHLKPSYFGTNLDISVIPWNLLPSENPSVRITIVVFACGHWIQVAGLGSYTEQGGCREWVRQVALAWLCRPSCNLNPSSCSGSGPCFAKRLHVSACWQPSDWSAVNPLLFELFSPITRSQQSPMRLLWLPLTSP